MCPLHCLMLSLRYVLTSVLKYKTSSILQSSVSQTIQPNSALPGHDDMKVPEMNKILLISRLITDSSRSWVMTRTRQTVRQFWQFVSVRLRLRGHLAYAPLREDTEELEAELVWASQRPESMWATHNATATDPLKTPLVTDSDVFEKCLTPWEHGAYKGYQQQFGPSIYSLNQNPDERPTFAKNKAPFGIGYGLAIIRLLESRSF